MNEIYLKAVDCLQDLLNNEKCSCVNTYHRPCPRCRVSIQQANEILVEIRLIQEKEGKTLVSL